MGSTDDLRRGLNTSGPLDFPIEVALSARLVTTAHLALPAEPVRCSCPMDLAVDSLVLLWTGGPAAAPSPFGTSVAVSDETGSEVVDAILLPEAVAAAEA